MYLAGNGHPDLPVQVPTGTTQSLYDPMPTSLRCHESAQAWVRCPPTLMGRCSQGRLLGAITWRAQMSSQAFGSYVPTNTQGQHCSFLTVLHATLAFLADMWGKLPPVSIWPGFPGVSVVKKFTCQCRSRRRFKFDPWVKEIPWRRKWQPTPVFLLGKSHWQRSLVGYRSRGCKESGTTEVTEHLTPSTSLYTRCLLSRNTLRFNARQHRNSPWHLLLYLLSSPKGWKVKDEQNCAWPQWVIIWRRTTNM